jgi:SMC interacting uncharacterized protein involved in chromosome segregation
VQLRKQSEALQEQAQSLCESIKNLQVNPGQFELLRRQTEELRKNLRPQPMKGFQKQVQRFNSYPGQWAQPGCADCV